MNRQPTSSLVDNLAISVEKLPGSISFVCGSDRLTFAELWRASRQLSACLDERGVEHQEAIALLLPRCLQSSIAVYGTMYGGRIWFPIDPTSPDDLIRQILEDNQCRVLISHPFLVRKIQSLLDGDHPLHTVIGLDNGTLRSDLVTTFSWSDIGLLEETRKESCASEQDVAYVIHTSGSTGRPKGIIHTHFSGSSYAKLVVGTFEITSKDTLGCHGPLHTDMCTMGFLAAPSVGATTHIIPDTYVKVPASLSSYIETAGITVWYSVPQALVQLVTGGLLHSRNLNLLRWVIYAGESIAPKWLLQLLDAAPMVQVCNVYGPAETNQCTHYVINGKDELMKLDESKSQVPIGNVWEETSALLLDTSDEPVTPDEIGELVINSSTMMRGYLIPESADSQTSESSIYFDDPESNIRYYRTGDLARKLTDGNLVLVGRRDRQVKVRGMRVELDAIELLLTKHPDVIIAAVVCLSTEEPIIGNQIRAAVMTKSEGDSDAIVEHLRGHLPVHAIPENVRIVKTMPLTGGGKIDRLKLMEQLGH